MCVRADQPRLASAALRTSPLAENALLRSFLQAKAELEQAGAHMAGWPDPVLPMLLFEFETVEPNRRGCVVGSSFALDPELGVVHHTVFEKVGPDCGGPPLPATAGGRST